MQAFKKFPRKKRIILKQYNFDHQTQPSLKEFAVWRKDTIEKLEKRLVEIAEHINLYEFAEPMRIKLRGEETAYQKFLETLK